MDPIAHALLAVTASVAGDSTGAANHLAAARRRSQSATRRHRQLIEIAGLVVAGTNDRATGLALVHSAEFPQDAEILAGMTQPPTEAPDASRRGVRQDDRQSSITTRRGGPSALGSGSPGAQRGPRGGATGEGASASARGRLVEP